MSAIGSIPTATTAIHQPQLPKVSSVKINDGDADDLPKTAAPTKLATSGPGQLLSKIA